MYKILIIDEEKDVFDDFKDYVDDSQLKAEFNVVTEFPLNDLDEMIDLVIQINPDAVITDFKLNEIKTDIKYNVPYTGADLVRKFRAIRDEFPCFILTSFDDQAINQSNDVNIVYIKNLLHDDVESKTKARATFLARIKSQIIHYKTKISNAEARLLELLKLRLSGKATLEEENELIELDHLLEKAIDKRSSIPDDFKKLSNTEKLDEILSKVDDMLNKITNKNGK